MKPYRAYGQIARWTLVVCAISALFGWLIYPRITNAAAPDPVTAAWERARAAGSYHFTSDVTQVTLPLATITNVGRMSRTEKFYLEGQNDLKSETMELTLWSEGGSVLNSASGLSVRSQGGKTFARRGQGEWQEIDDFTESIAPQGDFMSYLAAIKDVQPQPAETRGGVQFTRYTFAIDSPRFAVYMRQQMEAALRARGELPPTLHLDAPAYFRDMIGAGELWVGEDGLPLRQILTLQFPAQQDEQVQSQIVVDFSKFGRGQLAVSSEQSSVVSRWLGAEHWSLLTGYFTPIAIVFSLITGAALLLIHRRARLVQITIVTLVIVAQVAGPVLTTVVNVRFFDAQTAKAAAQEERQAAADEERQLREALGTVEFNPHLNPLETGDWRLETGDSPAEASLQSPVSNLQSTTDSGLDSDSDGLTDFAEERVGTDPLFADSDEDGLSDQLEVMGFTLPNDPANRRWYLNPLEVDSNRDGQADALEWDNNGDGIPDDIDNDQIPDLFDDDNDNDGVPDSKDSSPFAAATRPGGFTEANPFQLQIQNLTTGAPTFVDFQLRPQQANHLWFAFNVLDWPQDSQGQIRDVDGKSYADLTPAGGAPAANNTLGDMKLAPMLEVRMPTASANLPPASDLLPYNITVNDYTADGATKIAYLPLSLVTDEQTGQRVAFTARMRYLPTASWGQAHEVRLVWLVQALVDLPCDPQAADAEPACAADGYIHNVPQVIRSYYDAFTLTGLNVREDHGAGAAIIYEDPSVDSNLKDDTALVALSHGLDNSFLAARDQNDDGWRDVTLAEIARRFDRDANSTVTEVERWGIANTLQVERQTYATGDQAVVSVAMTETTRILNNAFQSYWNADQTIQPLLMFAQEETYRALGLDALRASGNYVTLNGATLTLDMRPTGQLPVRSDTLASLKWVPYCAPEGATPRWAPCELDSYWTELEQRYAPNTPLPGYPNDPDVIAGNMAILQLYFLSLIQGYTRAVLRNNLLVSNLYTLKSDSELDGYLRTGTGLGNTVVKTLTNKFVMARFVDKVSVLTYLGRQFREFRGGSVAQALSNGPINIVRSFFSSGNINRLVATGIIVGVGVVLAGLATGVYFLVDSYLSSDPARNLGAKIAIKALTISITTYLSVLGPIKAALEWVKLVRSAGGTASSVLNGSSQLLGATRTASIVGTVIGVGITWGFFIYSMVANNVTAFSPTFNRAMAETIAATIYLILLFVLSLTVIGTILVGIVAIIDAILTAICELGVDQLRDVPGLGGACFTLGNSAIKVLAYSIYNYDLMINTDRSDLMVTGSPQVTLADSTLGYAAGNVLTVTLPVTTTVAHKDPDPANGLLIYPYLWLYSQDSLKSSTFKYSLDRTANVTPTVALDDMKDAWQNVSEDHKFVLTPMYKGTANTTPAPLGGYALTAGLNRPIPFTLNMGFAVPAYECWGVLVAGVCYRREYQGGNHLPINSLFYDVFPATLDGFMSLTNSGDGGLRLGWDAAFPTLRDADGDGLLSAAYKGLDPNDASVDSDNDGLTDRYELEKRQAGYALSPISRDTDNDGLTDLQEMLLGSNPGVADTDNDGLLDGEEVYHQRYDPTTGAPTGEWTGGWEVTINAATPFTMRVSSDPFRADSDGDGVSDLAERQLAQHSDPAQRIDNQNRPYHPRVPNTPPLAIFVATDDADGYLAPGQSLRYTSTVVANTAVAPGVLNVTAPSVLGGAINPLALGFDPLTFTTAQTVTQAINLAVAGNVGTQPARLTSTASTRLPNTGAGGWSFTPPVFEAPLGGFVPPTVASFSAVTASRPDRQDNYLLSALAIQPVVGLPLGLGDILAYSLPGGSVRAIENDNNNTNAILHDLPPGMATNAQGDTLAAWSYNRWCNTVTINSLKVVTAGADHGTGGIEPFITFQPATGGEEQIWYWTYGTGGSNDVVSNTQFGPNAAGFPITRSYCGGPGTLRVYESDGPVNDPSQNTRVGTSRLVSLAPRDDVLTFTGDGHTIEVHITVPTVDQHRIAGALLGPDGEIKRSINFLTPFLPTNDKIENFGPAVASNGNGFVVAYETFWIQSDGLTSSPYVIAQSFDKDGNPFNYTIIRASDLQGVGFNNNIAIDVAWVGNAYRVLWQDRRESTVWMAEMSADGEWFLEPIPVATNALTNAGATYRPSLAYDPLSGRTLVVYLDATRSPVGKIYQDATFVGTTYQLPIRNASSIKAVWHPGYRGWLVGIKAAGEGTTAFAPVDASGDRPFVYTVAFSDARNDNSLACPAPQSYPLVDLRFEELPGATTFTDGSGYGNNATCTGAACPAAGLPAAPNAPLSDYAVRFDGGNDRLTINAAFPNSFTAAYWVKATPNANNSVIVVDQGANANNGWTLSFDAGRPAFLVNTGSYLVAPTRIDDNQWHFVAGTRDQATGAMALYVDGNQVASGVAGANALTAVTNLLIGGDRSGNRTLTGQIDHLQLWPVALAQETIQAIYNRTNQSYCVAAGTGGSNVYWAKVQASQPDVRGGPLSASNGLTLTIDSDLPTAQITAVQNNNVVGPGQVIGGAASDATSGVGLVEVSLNNGPWTAANGANSWAFSLAGQNGAISLRVRATDNVGNVGNPSAPLNLTVDGVAPTLAVNPPPPTIKPVRNAAGQWQVPLSGAASDAGGVNPASLLVQLTQQSGVGVAQTLQPATLTGNTWNINYLLNDGLFDPTGAYTVTVSAADLIGNEAPPATTVVRLDTRGPSAALSPGDTARTVITQTLTLGGVISDTDSIAGIDKLEIAFTPVEQVAALPAGLTSEQAEAQLNRTWTPVTLAQRGAGVATTTWSAAIPAGLENVYQIDLRGTDMLGNVAISAGLWRGAIDTLNPRVVMTATATGVTYINPADDTQLHEVRFVCAAQDRNLAEATFVCPGQGLVEPVRSFDHYPSLQALFPDLTIRSGLALSYTLWTATNTPAATVRACDSYGRCAQATTPETVTAAADLQVSSLQAAQAPGAPLAMIVNPTAGSFVAAGDNLAVTVAAEAGAGLKEVTIKLDNTVVQTLSFAASPVVTRSVRTVNVPVATEGAHTLVAQTTDWANATQTTLFPVTFTLDQNPPALTIDASPLTLEDTWQAGSGILRFNGVASDSVGLAAVQIREGNNRFTDATFGNGAWRVALPVLDPEGRSLNITVRAIDRAGRITTLTQPIATDLSAADAPDTSISSGPADPSNVNTAQFVFSGSTTAVVFECQLDNGIYTPCASPTAYSDLSKGSHTFRVRAIDSRGLPDLSPAEFTWTVAASQLDATITSRPANPTSERSANFVFTGSGGATSFECSLDGAIFAPCTSPKSYSGLGSGEHTFLVRARNGDTVGAADRYTWTVLNAPPTANDLLLNLLENSAVAITLQGNDGDPLVYQLVEQPQHGLLLGLPPHLTYAPDTGYAGPDRFTYRAWDGEAYSAPATVNLTVRLARYAIFGGEGVALDQNSRIVSGDVGVNVKSNGPFLRNNVELSIGQNSVMQETTSRILADSIYVHQNATVYNPSYNDIQGPGRVNGTRTTPLALPLRTALPGLPVITPGAQNVDVAQNSSRTLAPGSYGALNTGQNTTILLTGGLYHFASWNVGQNSRLHFQAPSEVRIAGRLAMGQNGVLAPAPGTTGLDATQIILYVAGQNGSNGAMTATPRAVDFGQGGRINAYIVAPNGTIYMGQNAQNSGAFIARWVYGEQNTRITRPAEPVITGADANPVGPVTAVPADDPTNDPGPTAPESDLTLVAFLPLVTAHRSSANEASATATPDASAEAEIVTGATAPPLAPEPSVTPAPGEEHNLAQEESGPEQAGVDRTQVNHVYLPLIHQ